MTQFNEAQLRDDLAASFRIIAHLGMHEAVANHFSASLNEAGTRFLINPKWRHFSRIGADDLLAIDIDDPESRAQLDPTAWALHSQLHRLHPHARVIMHLHPIHTTAVACLAEPAVPPIDQNTARYFNRIAVDKMYGGMADSEAEGERIARLLGDKTRLLMGNHGVLIVADTVGEAFDDIYTLERACQILVNARALGAPLKVLDDEVAEATARDWEGIRDFSIAHFEEMKLVVSS